METISFLQANAASYISSLSLGLVAPASSDDLLLRVVNDSSLYQAKDVTITVSGTNANQIFLSGDGDNFSNSVNVGDIAPGGVSPSFTLRRVTPRAATGSGTATLTAVPTSWTSPIDTSASDNIPLDTE